MYTNVSYRTKKKVYNLNVGWKVYNLAAIPKCKCIVLFRLGYPLL